MRLSRFALILLALACLASVLSAQGQPRKRRILAIGAVKGWQHDSVSHALATIEKMGTGSAWMSRSGSS